MTDFPSLPPVTMDSALPGPAQVEALRKQAESIAAKGSAPASVKAQRLREVAEQFDEAMMQIVMKEMAKTVDESGFVEDASSKQIRGMFWQFLGETVCKQGGTGLADDLYREFCRMAHVDEPAAGQGGSTLEVLR